MGDGPVAKAPIELRLSCPETPIFAVANEWLFSESALPIPATSTLALFVGCMNSITLS